MKKWVMTGICLAIVSVNAAAQDDSETIIRTTTTTSPVGTPTTVITPSTTVTPATTITAPSVITPTTTVTTPVTTTPVLTTTPATVVTTTPVIQRQAIVTSTPEVSAENVVAIPEGYTNCFTVAGGWQKDVWVSEHQVCQYSTIAPVSASAVTSGTETTTTIRGSTWVAGYWTCPKYNTSWECTSWVWKPGRWVDTLQVY